MDAVDPKAGADKRGFFGAVGAAGLPPPNEPLGDNVPAPGLSNVAEREGERLARRKSAVENSRL